MQPRTPSSLTARTFAARSVTALLAKRALQQEAFLRASESGLHAASSSETRKTALAVRPVSSP